MVTVPTPSSPDPDHSRRSRPYGGRGDRPRDGRRAGPYERGDAGNGGSGAFGAHGGGHQDVSGAGGHSDGWHGGPPDGPEATGPRVRREVRDGTVVALVVAVLGVALGLLWWWLAPRVQLFSVDHSVFLKDPEGEEAVGIDGTFVLLALAFGAVTGVLAFLRSRRGGVGIVVGLAAGALLGSVVAWRLGVWLGPESDLAAAAKAAGTGKTFDGPLKLQAKGALLVWPLLGLFVHLVLMGLFGKREPELPAQFPPTGGRGATQDW